MNAGCRIAVFTVILMVLSFPGSGMSADTAARSHQFGSGDHEIGVVLGEPSGLSFKSWTDWNTAFDIGLAWSFKREGYLNIHADYLFHNFGFFEIDNDRMPLYFGFGGRVRLENDTRIGARFVIGAEYYHEEFPVGFFFELAPIFDIIPETEFDMNAGIGVRILF